MYICQGKNQKSAGPLIIALKQIGIFNHENYFKFLYVEMWNFKLKYLMTICCTNLNSNISTDVNMDTYDMIYKVANIGGLGITLPIFRRVFIKLHHSFIYCLFPQNEMPALYRFYFPHFLLRTEIRPAQSSVIHHLYFF